MGTAISDDAMSRFALEMIDWSNGHAIVRAVDVDPRVVAVWAEEVSYIELVMKHTGQRLTTVVRAEIRPDGLVRIGLPAVNPAMYQITAGLSSPRLSRVVTCFTINAERWDLGENRFRRAVAVSEWDAVTLFRIRSICLSAGYAWLSTDVGPRAIGKGLHQLLQISVEELANREDDLPVSEAVLTQFSRGPKIERAVGVEPKSFDAMWSRLWTKGP